ncbi:uncharacterized protein LOC120078343 [Benincasa hispida]|uniref:uncharacterized protein LOC120078343 n=1 Tax=Benincasa hispida TaxID=102211 RepID=UPI001900B4DB|nr:uncharacterized protein LOC120078343 [Benincasa hispida]
MEDDEEAKLSHHPQHYSSSSSSMTLFSRLDHLDFVMKDLEKKQRLGRFGGSNLEEGMEKRCISLDVALKDTYFKGSLLDRVATLENRLFQLCLEMDSGNSSNPSSLTSSQTSVEICSSSSPKQFCRGQPSSSYPTFHYPNHGRTSQISQIQEKPQRQQQKKMQESLSKGQEVGKTRTEKDEVGSCKNVKKGIPSLKWPHLRMFGC